MSGAIHFDQTMSRVRAASISTESGCKMGFCQSPETVQKWVKSGFWGPKVGENASRPTFVDSFRDIDEKKKKEKSEDHDHMCTKPFLRESWSWSLFFSSSGADFLEDHDHMCSTFSERKSWSWSSSFSSPPPQKPLLTPFNGGGNCLPKGALRQP